MTTRQAIEQLNKDYDWFIFEHTRNAYKPPKYPFIVRQKETKKVIARFKTLVEIYQWLNTEEENL